MTTAFIGSSNLSHTALFDGLEWNVRLAQSDAGHVINTVRRTFEAHWASDHFQLYDPRVRQEDRHLLDRALRVHDKSAASPGRAFVSFDIGRATAAADARSSRRRTQQARPHRNLIVAATGTGKTVLAALDYRRLRALSEADDRHRCCSSRITKTSSGQALATYRAVLDDPTSASCTALGSGPRGSTCSRWCRPSRAKNKAVRARVSPARRSARSIPSSSTSSSLTSFTTLLPRVYRRLLEHFRPKELLGLTATPERTDASPFRTSSLADGLPPS